MEKLSSWLLFASTFKPHSFLMNYSLYCIGHILNHCVTHFPALEILAYHNTKATSHRVSIRLISKKKSGCHTANLTWGVNKFWRSLKEQIEKSTGLKSAGDLKEAVQNWATNTGVCIHGIWHYKDIIIF